MGLLDKKNIEQQPFYYTMAMSEEDIYMIGLLMRKFRNNQINFQKLKNKLEKINIDILKCLYSNIESFKLKEDALNLKRRIQEGNLLYTDIQGYILFLGEKNVPVLFMNDRVVLEIMAKYSDKEAIDTLNGIESFQYRKFGVKQRVFKQRKRA